MQRLVGELSLEKLSRVIVHAAREAETIDEEDTPEADLAIAIEITNDAYEHLKQSFAGVSDEHMMRLLIQHLNRSLDN